MLIVTSPVKIEFIFFINLIHVFFRIFTFLNYHDIRIQFFNFADFLPECTTAIPCNDFHELQLLIIFLHNLDRKKPPSSSFPHHGT